jgi:competence protein ComGC
MKLPKTTRRCRAFNYFELLVVVAALVVLTVLLLPFLRSAKQKAQWISCNGQLKEINFANKIWANDNTNKFPAQIANEDAMNFEKPGAAYRIFLTMSNEIGAPQILHCPADKETTATYHFENLMDSNISYFLNLDATEEAPQTILYGDDNLIVNGKPVRPGILNLTTNSFVEWSAERHHFAGNIALADGSVQQTTSSFLHNMIAATGAATNRLIIP